METKTKTQTFLGFAVRARKAVFGGNSVAALKRAEVILISPDASENTLKEGKKLAAKLKCKAFVTDRPLEEMVFRSGVKIVAVTDKALGKAIAGNADGTLKEAGVEIKREGQN